MSRWAGAAAGAPLGRKGDRVLLRAGDEVLDPADDAFRAIRRMGWTGVASRRW